MRPGFIATVFTLTGLSLATMATAITGVETKRIGDAARVLTEIEIGERKSDSAGHLATRALRRRHPRFQERRRHYREPSTAKDWSAAGRRTAGVRPPMSRSRKAALARRSAWSRWIW